MFERASARQIVQRVREDLDINFTNTDDQGKSLSVTSMVDRYYTDRSLDDALPTGLADRVATLSFSPAPELDRTKREFLRRLGGVPVAMVAGYSGRFDFERVPVFVSTRRAVQQAPHQILRFMPRLHIPLEEQQTDEEALHSFVIDTVQVAENAAVLNPKPQEEE
jgi:hypothetical protein